MITEDYCSYEVAKLLKEKGFNEFYYYVPKHNNDGTSEAINTCTHALAMKWLREQGVYIVINPWLTTLKPVSYWYSITTREHYFEQEDFSTYEAAVEAALKYSLENLI